MEIIIKPYLCSKVYTVWRKWCPWQQEHAYLTVRDVHYSHSIDCDLYTWVWTQAMWGSEWKCVHGCTGAVVKKTIDTKWSWLLDSWSRCRLSCTLFSKMKTLLFTLCSTHSLEYVIIIMTICTTTSSYLSFHL